MVYKLNKYLFAKDNELIKEAFELIDSRNIYNGNYAGVLQDSIKKTCKLIDAIEEPFMTLTEHLGALIVAIKFLDDTKREEILSYLEEKAKDLSDIACKLEFRNSKVTSAFVTKCIELSDDNEGEINFCEELKKLGNEKKCCAKEW